MKIREFLNAIIAKITGNTERDDGSPIEELAKASEVQWFSSLEQEEGESEKEAETEQEIEEQINVAKRTLTTKLYQLEQDIAVFAIDFPSEYQNFLQRIKTLKSSYDSQLEQFQKELTFEIDPETCTYQIGEVIRLEKDIKHFIESTVKFHIISNRLQRLIKKLNIIYNVSIFLSQECEKEKIRLQLEHVIQVERNLAEQFKTSNYILTDRQQKERIIELLSYTDYEIFKSSIRNSHQSPKEFLSKLVMVEEFEEFDYGTAFIAYLKDELSDLLELLPFISDEKQHKLLKKNSEMLLSGLAYCSDFNQLLLEREFWNEYFSFETTLLEMLKFSGFPKEKVTVKVIDRMGIEVEEDDVLVCPISNTKLALIRIYATTHDSKVLLMIKLLENLSKEVTYREIYFLLLLFDILPLIRNTANDLLRQIEKYMNKHSCKAQDMIEKKKQVMEMVNKEYVVLFHLDNDADEIIDTLTALNLDFKVKNDTIFINSFYFKDLEHVVRSLKENTPNNIENGGLKNE